MRFTNTLAAGAALAVMLCITGSSFGQIKLAASPHNLNNWAGAKVDKQQVCLPCHTPHGSALNSEGGTGELLWNHNTNWGTSYTMYTSPGQHTTRYSGTSSANPVLDSTSRLCLSCHDGAIAVDSYGASGSNTVSTLTIDKLGTGSAKLGTDLSTSHPVGISYPGLSADGKTFTASAASGYIDPTTANWGRTVTTGSALGGGINFSTVSGKSNVIGCGTCHTPHTYTYNFVKVDNTGSQLCFKCHDK
jgi:predicted CXXCH cytochrome family protein